MLDSLMPIKDGFYNSELSPAISSKLLFWAYYRAKSCGSFCNPVKIKVRQSLRHPITAKPGTLFKKNIQCTLAIYYQSAQQLSFLKYQDINEYCWLVRMQTQNKIKKSAIEWVDDKPTRLTHLSQQDVSTVKADNVNTRLSINTMCCQVYMCFLWTQ